jgi:hypothetical protein
LKPLTKPNVFRKHGFEITALIHFKASSRPNNITKLCYVFTDIMAVVKKGDNNRNNLKHKY